MRAPSGKRSDDEIITDIVKLVSYPPIKMLVLRRIDDLRAILPLFTGNQRENIEYAKELRRLIIKLERMLKRPQSRFLTERFWSLWGAQGTAIEINPNTRDYIAQETEYQKRFAEELNRLRKRSDDILKYEPGKHGNTKSQHRHAAIASFEVLESVGGYTGTEPWPTDSPDGKLCRVASLFHEAATGEYDADLREACRAVLREKTKK